MLWWIYRLAGPLALGLAVPWLAFKGLANPLWRGVLAGRLALGEGLLDRRAVERGGPFWLHAVSVGEVLALRAVVERLQTAVPDLPLLVSTSTPTGNRLALETMPEGVRVRYFPLDTAGCVRRALARERPCAAAIMETEIWPAFFIACRRRGIPLAIINGRMSATSLGRYRKIRSLIGEVLGGVCCGCFQSQADLQRFVDLGLPPDRGSVPGNLKYDLENLQALTSGSAAGAGIAAAWRDQGDGREARPLVVAGSTKPGEEQLVLDALAPLMHERPGLLLLLAPRHPERFDEVARLLENCGFPFSRRSAIGPGQPPPPGCRVLLLDSLGELAGVYGQSTAAFVGGSLVAEGGHNILEPAYFGKPVIFGPHMDNFAEMAALFTRREAAFQLSSADQLAPVVRRLLDDPAAADLAGRRARWILEENQGAAAAIAAALLQLANSSG
jgi:3-deoxy-D-manno-octulosonic-acid transferase